MRHLRHWLHRRQRPLRHALLEPLLAAQSLAPAILRRQTEDALRTLVDFARRTTAYYRETLRDLPDDWRIEDLPILTKADVTARLADLLADGHDPRTTAVGHTSGSTGRPLAFWYDAAKHELMRAGMMRSYMLSGWRPGDRILNFWGARQDTVRGGVFGSTLIDEFIAAERTLPAHEVSPQKLAAWARCVQRYRPVLLQGYASVLAALARFVIDERILLPPGLIAVYSTAELLDDAQRALMETAFGCKVFNQYGSREIPNIACECRRGRMHVFTDMVRLESVAGRLLVTALTNRLMPMIRYENGDAGELLDERCDCGSPFPLMSMSLCRQNDFIRTPDGRRIHPAALNRLLYGQTWISAYRFIQHASGALLLEIVAERECDHGRLAGLRDNIRRGIDATLEVAVRRVDSIERSACGKHRFVISHLENTT